MDGEPVAAHRRTPKRVSYDCNRSLAARFHHWISLQGLQELRGTF